MTSLPGDTELPPSIRLRPHHPVLPRAADTLQLGVGPGGAVEVSELSPALRRLLLEWHGARRLEELIVRAGELGAEVAETRTLLAELYAAGAVIDANGPERAAAGRKAASVLITGAGPLVAGVASGLAAAGVGTLGVLAEGTVLAEDVGDLAAADRGRPRAGATEAAIRRVAPGARVVSGAPRGRADLAVLADALNPDPERLSALLADGVPHLVARLADGVGLVGPLVLPGRSACLRCVDLHRAGRDPHWPRIAAALAGRVGSASPATAAATAALAAEQALAALDAVVAAAPPPPTLDTVLELDLRRGELRRRRWPPHPGCGCGAAHIRTGDTGAEPTTSGGVRPGATVLPANAQAACAG